MTIKISHFVFLAAAAALAGCVSTSPTSMEAAEDADSLTAALSGRTLTTGNATIVLGADGSMSGNVGADELTGAWTERNGQYCRTITAPQRIAGTLCQNVRFNSDGTATFLGGVNGDVTWDIS